VRDRKTARRRRWEIALATLAFVALSGAAHLFIGSVIDAHLPHWTVPDDEQVMTRTTLARLVATPPPTPIPTPPPPRPAQERRADANSPQRFSHAIPPRARSSRMPERSVPVAPPPAPATPLPQPDETAAPLATQEPESDATQPATDATFRYRAQPGYTPLCEQEGATGSVVIDVTIGPGGSLVSVDVGQTSGFPCLDAAALAAAKESTYNPPEVGGRPATKTYIIVYDFTIDS
jgi:protein TonB